MLFLYLHPFSLTRPPASATVTSLPQTDLGLNVRKRKVVADEGDLVLDRLWGFGDFFFGYFGPQQGVDVCRLRNGRLLQRNASWTRLGALPPKTLHFLMLAPLSCGCIRVMRVNFSTAHSFGIRWNMFMRRNYFAIKCIFLIFECEIYLKTWSVSINDLPQTYFRSRNELFQTSLQLATSELTRFSASFSLKSFFWINEENLSGFQKNPPQRIGCCRHLYFFSDGARNTRFGSTVAILDRGACGPRHSVSCLLLAGVLLLLYLLGECNASGGDHARLRLHDRLLWAFAAFHILESKAAGMADSMGKKQAVCEDFLFEDFMRNTKRLADLKKTRLAQATSEQATTKRQLAWL